MYFKENVSFDVEQPSRLWRHRRQLDGARRNDVISRTVGQFCQILCSGPENLVFEIFYVKMNDLIGHKTIYVRVYHILLPENSASITVFFLLH